MPNSFHYQKLWNNQPRTPYRHAQLLANVLWSFHSKSQQKGHWSVNNVRKTINVHLTAENSIHFDIKKFHWTFSERLRSAFQCRRFTKRRRFLTFSTSVENLVWCNVRSSVQLSEAQVCSASSTRGNCREFGWREVCGCCDGREDLGMIKLVVVSRWSQLIVEFLKFMCQYWWMFVALSAC
jgi:hypothetical protein